MVSRFYYIYLGNYQHYLPKTNAIYCNNHLGCNQIIRLGILLFVRDLHRNFYIISTSTESECYSNNNLLANNSCWHPSLYQNMVSRFLLHLLHKSSTFCINHILQKRYQRKEVIMNNNADIRYNFSIYFHNAYYYFSLLVSIYSIKKSIFFLPL